MIKAVFFDLDGTLRHNLPSGGEFFADHAAQVGLRVREDDRLRAARWEHYYWANSPELHADKQAHPDGEDDAGFWALYARRQLVALGASNAEADELAPKLTAYMTAAYKPESVVPQDALRLLPVLQQAGYVLGVLSNRSKPFGEEIAGLGLGSYFALALAGGEVSMWKPEPHLFVHACERLKVAPAQAMYVGDNYFADVIGARRAGLEPVLYDPRGVFDDPGCTVIRSFDELHGVIRTK